MKEKVQRRGLDKGEGRHKGQGVGEDEEVGAKEGAWAGAAEEEG